MKFAVTMALAGVGCVASVALAGPVTVSFGRVTSNADENVASQFSAVVSEVAGQPNRVDFRFSNTAVIESSISEVYFDSRNTSPLSSLLGLTQQGARFVGGGANPGNLPGGNGLTTPFQAVGSFSADAQGNPSRGLDVATDFLTMTFRLSDGGTFDSLVAALRNGDLRLGLHVRAIGDDGKSDSFVSTPPPPPITVIPLPSAAASAFVGLLALGGIRRR
ncbi:MAG: hypothetical protein SFZ23_12160 [Planctomycetota bacterium]|nr:hypothetical protein [Planctomycetota bacterium]